MSPDCNDTFNSVYQSSGERTPFRVKKDFFLRKGLILSLKLFIRLCMVFNILKLKLSDINPSIYMYAL